MIDNEDKHVWFIDYQGPDLLPTPAPESILGTKEYYTWRDNDFYVRQELMDDWLHWQPSSPDYYMDYGDKYARRFTDELYPKLSSAGHDWLIDARLNLQLAIEEELETDPQIEVDNSAFEEFCFDSHVASYEDAGLFELPISDLLLIAFTPDFDDLISADGREQIIQIATDYLEHARENPTEAASQWIDFTIDVINLINSLHDEEDDED